MESNIHCLTCRTERSVSQEVCPTCSSVVVYPETETPTRILRTPIAHDLEGGEIAGRYEVREVVGRGGFGVVVKAFDRHLERHVAIKRLATVTDRTSDEGARFIREARILARLDHPNIVPVFDAGIDDEHPYIAMKLIDGESLHRRLRAGPFSEPEALDILRQASEALAHAHRKKVLHRDLKPSNIILGEDGRIFLVDFGLSAAGFGPELSQRGLVVGTLHYLSPDALGGEYSERSDLYSLGAVLYEMVFGRPCFTGKAPYEIIARIIRESPELLVDPPPDASGCVLDLMASLLDKDASRRPSTARHLVRISEAVLEELAGGASPAVVLPGQPLETEERRKLESGIESVETRVKGLFDLVEKDSASEEAVLELLAGVVSEAVALTDRLRHAAAGRAREPVLETLMLSLGHMAGEVETRLSARFRGDETSPLTGLLSHLWSRVIAPLRDSLAQLDLQVSPPGEEGSFFVFEETVEEPAPAGDGADWVGDLLSDDELKRHEAVRIIARAGRDLFLSYLRACSERRQKELLRSLWSQADLLLLEGRAHSRPVFEVALELAGEGSEHDRWFRLFSLFKKAGEDFWDPMLVSRMLEDHSEEDRRLIFRALVFHPWQQYRELALQNLAPHDLWSVVSHESTSIQALLEIWLRFAAEADESHLKVLFVCVRDRLIQTIGEETIVSAVELVKELYKVDAFHEDSYFNMLVELDEHLRAEGKRHHLLIDFDSEYVERLKGFLAGGKRREQEVGGWGLIPLPVQRNLARRGHFLRHFVSHPVDPIALECISHLSMREDVTDFVKIFSINGRILTELAKIDRLFVHERPRFALVSNPKTPAFVVVKYARLLRRDSLRKLATSHEYNQFARGFAKKILGRAV